MFISPVKRAAVVWALPVNLLLSACGMSPNFVHEPPPSYRVSPPPEIQGVWAREGPDNGERARVTALSDGTMRIDIFKTKPSPRDKSKEPIIAQALRFDNTDWLLIDLRRLAAREGDTFTGAAPYKIIRYALKNENRLCGTEPSASLFAKAIESGQLQGSVQSDVKPLTRVNVTSTGEEWVTWWNGLPASEKMFAQPVFCFLRMD